MQKLNKFLGWLKIEKQEYYLINHVKRIDIINYITYTKQKVLNYLESQHNGGKNSLTRIGGLIDSLDPDEIERILPALV